MCDSNENYGVFYERKDYAGFIRRVTASVVDLIVFVVFCLVSGSMVALLTGDDALLFITSAFLFLLLAWE